jgi:myo-inositol-1(or 4)-monophosphatase
MMVLARDLRRAGAASSTWRASRRRAAGRYFERGLKPWDHAAGALLVTEAASSADARAARPVRR